MGARTTGTPEGAQHHGERAERPSGRRRGSRPGAAPAEERPSTEGIEGWLAGRLPDWFEGAPTVTVDRDEITVVGRIPLPDLEDGADEATRAAAAAGRITRFREETRPERMAIDREVQHRYGRSIAWGAEAGGSTAAFTSLSIPVMTRLRQPERLVLDTLVDSGVARSRSDALAWCVKLVGANVDPWLADLREAMQAVESVRREGPEVS